MSRMVNVSPRDVERYALRLLLMHVPGATCEEDLRTVEGTVYRSCKLAATARGLVVDDAEFTLTLHELRDALSHTTSVEKCAISSHCYWCGTKLGMLLRCGQINGRRWDTYG